MSSLDDWEKAKGKMLEQRIRSSVVAAVEESLDATLRWNELVDRKHLTINVYVEAPYSVHGACHTGGKRK